MPYFFRVREASLTMKPSKCQVGFSRVDFVGYKVGSGLVLTQSDNVLKVRDAQIPHTKTHIRSLLGSLGITGNSFRVMPVLQLL